MKLSLIKGIFLFIIASTILYCSKSEDTQQEQEVIDQETDNELPEEDNFNYTSPKTHNLNIIYFIPKDIENRINSHKRISEILLQGQEFYKQNMIAYGFGEKTFGLLVDTEKNRVKVTYINGKHDASHYPYEGGGNIMKEEILTYFTANPNEKNSEHFLVISPVNDPKNNDAPYYGIGKWCFATDFNDMDVKHLGNTSELGRNATVYIGGLLHELGHGLNLPHNKEKASDISNPNKGTCLMGGGNYTYGSTPTFISEASCAILNNNQIFNNTNSNFYTGATGAINNLVATVNDNIINVSGTIVSSIPVNRVNVYHDPADDNANYDAVSWSTTVSDHNTFNLSMAVNELHKKGNTPYVLRFLLNHTSGDITNISYAYKFVNDKPVIDIGEKNYLDKTNWTITSISSEEASGQENTGLASAILDSNYQTYWHSCWTGTCAESSYPHSITINTGETVTANGFAFVQRQNLSRSIKNIEIFISNDNANWTSVGNHVLLNSNSVQNIRLENQVSFKYFKIEAKTAHDSNRFAALAEVFCF